MSTLTFQEGDRVDHIQYGEGTVLISSANMIKVQFDNSKADWVYIGYCTKLE